MTPEISTAQREYPLAPLVGVGALIWRPETGQVLLIQRGREPNKGLWSLPGGLVDVGESLTAAVVREAGKRTLKMRHFDVQLAGGMALHNRKIAEMRTGEGKTTVATLPVYLNALAGKGVHVVTVNDYLARRDAEWMGRLYSFLGLTVGVNPVSYTHLRAHETVLDLVCRLLLAKKNTTRSDTIGLLTNGCTNT